MKLRANILPKYFEQIKAGTKTIDYRQIEDITFVNTETKEEIVYTVTHVQHVFASTFDEVQAEYPDVKFDITKPIIEIFLGRKLTGEQIKSKTMNWQEIQNRLYGTAKTNDPLWCVCFVCKQKVHQGVFSLHIKEEHLEYWMCSSPTENKDKKEILK